MNCTMIGFAVIVGALVVRAETMSVLDAGLKFFLGFLTGFALTGASMAINDYWDREIDRINEPNRPIPSGLISTSESLFLAAGLISIGLVAASLTNLPCLVIAILTLIVSVSYNTKAKQTGFPGNLLVSLCVATPLIYGSFLVGAVLEPAALLFAMLAFLACTGREVTKGIVDVEGDRDKNIRTIVVSYGEKAGAYASSLFYVLASGLSLLPLYLKLVSLWFLPFVLVADVGFVLSSFLLVRDYSRESARRTKNLVLLWMMFALLAFMAGSVLKGPSL